MKLGIKILNPLAIMHREEDGIDLRLVVRPLIRWRLNRDRKPKLRACRCFTPVVDELVAIE